VILKIIRKWKNRKYMANMEKSLRVMPKDHVRVIKWFVEHEDGTAAEVAKDLGMDEKEIELIIYDLANTGIIPE